jgi:hypothetical protein
MSTIFPGRDPVKQTCSVRRIFCFLSSPLYFIYMSCSFYLQYRINFEGDNPSPLFLLLYLLSSGTTKTRTLFVYVFFHQHTNQINSNKMQGGSFSPSHFLPTHPRCEYQILSKSADTEDKHFDDAATA